MSQQLFSVPPHDWANSGSADVFLAVVSEYGFSTVGVRIILRNGCGI